MKNPRNNIGSLVKAMVTDKVAGLLRVKCIVVVRYEDLKFLYLEMQVEYSLCLLTIVLLYRFRNPLSSRIGRPLSSFAILKVVLYILTLSFIIGALFSYIKPKFVGNVVNVLKKVVKGGLSTTF